MAIVNINSIDMNRVGSIDINNVGERYLVEALANLGQRFSLTGDGFGTRTLVFSDLVNASSLDKDSYIGKITYGSSEHTKVYIGVVEINNPNEFIDSGTITPIELSNANYVSTGESETIDITISETSVENCSNAIIYSDMHNLVFSTIENLSNDEKRFTCQKYNKYTNDLDSGLYVIEIDEPPFTHMMLYISKFNESDSFISYNLNVYKLSGEQLNIDNNTITLDIDFIANNFTKNSSSNIQEQYSFTPETILSELYSFLEAYDQARISDFINTAYYSIGLHYEKSSGRFTLINEDTSIDPQIIDIVQYFNYDKTYVYRKLKEYYSKRHFQVDEESSILIAEVLKGIYSLVYNSENEETEIYVPLDYKFEFVYNTNNPSKIYFGTRDICIRYANESTYGTKINTLKALNDAAGLICCSNYVERIQFLKYSIEYDDEANIQEIHVENHYSLPYINKQGYWVINDIDTELYAFGEDAGNPNIVIIETDPNDFNNPNIITMADRDYFSSITWVEKTVPVKLPTKYVKVGNTLYKTESVQPDSNEHFKSIEDDDIIPGNEGVIGKFSIPILADIDPKILEENVDKLKYSIIINTAPVSAIDGYNEDLDFRQKINEIFGKNGRISSIWTLQYEDNNYSFKPRTTIEGWAADFNYLSNTDNLIGWTVNNFVTNDPDNYMFSHVVFDDANRQLKNQDEGVEKEPVYPVLFNANSDVYRSSGFKNDFNFSLRYLDKVDYVTDETLPEDLNSLVIINEQDQMVLVAGITFYGEEPEDPNNNTSLAELLLDNIEYYAYVEYDDEENGISINGVMFYDDMPEDPEDSRTLIEITIEGTTYYAYMDVEESDDSLVINDFSKSNYIKSISQSSKRYLEEWLNIEESSSKVSNSIYNGQTEPYNEYVPSMANNSVPVFDLSEVLVKDINTLNRVNILSMNNVGTTYYSYIGSRYNDDNKERLVIGTAHTDINIGTDTLVTSIDENQLETQNELDIDFEKTVVSSYSYFNNDSTFLRDTITNGVNWNKRVIGDTSYFTTKYVPVGKYAECLLKLNLSPELLYRFSYDSFYNDINAADKMFIGCVVQDKYTVSSNVKNMYVGDSIHIRKLLNDVMPQVDFSNIEVNSNNEVFTLDNIPVALKLSTANLEKNNYGEVFSVSSDVFTGNELHISYYVSNNTAYVSINETQDHMTLGPLYRLNEDYVSTNPYGDDGQGDDNTQTVETYEIIVSYDNDAGNVTGGGVYYSSGMCTITATPNEGYSFDSWTENDVVLSIDENYTFLVDSAHSITANFTINQYTINVSVNEEQLSAGSVSGGGTFDYGDECTVIATPNTGFTFDSWTINGLGVSTDEEYTFTVENDCDLVANFIANL